MQAVDSSMFNPYRSTSVKKSPAAASSRSNRKVTPALRLTRLLLLVAAMLISFVLGIIVHTVSTQSEVQAASVTGSISVHAPAPAAVDTEKQRIIVVPGDTLWTIAEQHLASGQDVREYITKLKKLNAMKSSALKAGQVLVLP
ncbi:LysM peptidoglycan-binding domain-containing protein [Paenibacillus koleovorans]|uniref:LysM peptidoglycan-binding domain-containing protein n=1 Tax=Paenibacillus koleovorans TaxID=121608 RepID=UPI0013E3941B|nr:LysM peptidoglycan-binding domain-containing protein [Paenibacillus koleovorans]